MITARKPTGRTAPLEQPVVLDLRTVTGRGGGPEKTILNAPRFLAGHYRNPVAYVRPQVDPDYDLADRACDLGVEFYDIPERGPADPRTLFRLLRLVKQLRPSLLHAHDYKTDALALLVGRRFRIPVMTTTHGFGCGGGRLELYYKVDRWALRRMAHVVAVSPDLRDRLHRWGVRPERCSMIENGIDLEAYVPVDDHAEAKRQLGLDPARKAVGAVGRLVDEKGFDVLIRAIGRLQDAGQDIELIIAGEGDRRTELEALAKSLGCEDRVRLVGHCDDPRRVYRAVDLYVLSSRREALPNALLEAMAMRLPTVATRVGGVPGLIQDRESGLLVAPESVDALAGAIQTVLGNVELCDRLGRAARERVASDYSFGARMDKIRRIYDAILGRGGNASIHGAQMASSLQQGDQTP
jgi:glycosyltransferase involved in cell wall biosynthesis